MLAPSSTYTYTKPNSYKEVYHKNGQNVRVNTTNYKTVIGMRHVQRVISDESCMRCMIDECERLSRRECRVLIHNDLSSREDGLPAFQIT